MEPANNPVVQPAATQPVSTYPVDLQSVTGQPAIQQFQAQVPQPAAPISPNNATLPAAAPVVQQQVQPPVAQPVTQQGTTQVQPVQGAVDVNTMIAQIEASTRAKEDQMRATYMAEAENKFKGEFDQYKQQSQEMINGLNTKIDGLQAAAKKETEAIINEYSAKLSQQGTQIENLNEQSAERQSQVPMQNSPFRGQAAAEQKPVDLMDRTDLSEQQKQELFFKGLGGRR